MNTNKRCKRRVEIPTGYFTIEKLQKQYPNEVNITLRYRVNREIRLGYVKRSGVRKTPMGRPLNLYLKTDPRELITKSVETNINYEI